MLGLALLLAQQVEQIAADPATAPPTQVGQHIERPADIDQLPTEAKAVRQPAPRAVVAPPLPLRGPGYTQVITASASVTPVSIATQIGAPAVAAIVSPPRATTTAEPTVERATTP